MLCKICKDDEIGLWKIDWLVVWVPVCVSVCRSVGRSVGRGRGRPFYFFSNEQTENMPKYILTLYCILYDGSNFGEMAYLLCPVYCLTEVIVLL